MNIYLKTSISAADADSVIKLRRIQGDATFIVNADLIETVEACPDTVITLVNKHRFIVADSVDEVLEKVVLYRASILSYSASFTLEDTAQDNSVAGRVMQVINTEELAS